MHRSTRLFPLLTAMAGLLPAVVLAQDVPPTSDEPQTEEAPEQVTSRSARPHGPSELPYLWDYERVEADHANFHNHLVAASVLVGPHSAATAELVHHYVLPEVVSLHTSAGIGVFTGHDGEVAAGPGYHLQTAIGYPLVDWRGYQTMSVRTSGPEGPVETVLHVPSHRRLTIEMGGVHSTVNFESTQRNTAPTFGLRWWVDWDFDARIGVNDREERYWGAAWVALHAVPVTWAGRGNATGPGVSLDVGLPLTRSRQHPTLLRLSGTYFPDGSMTGAAGIGVPLASF